MAPDGPSENAKAAQGWTERLPGPEMKGLGSRRSEEPSTTDGEAEVQRGEGLDQDPWPDPLLPEPFLASLSASRKQQNFTTNRQLPVGIDSGGGEGSPMRT